MAGLTSSAWVAAGALLLAGAVLAWSTGPGPRAVLDAAELVERDGAGGRMTLHQVGPGGFTIELLLPAHLQLQQGGSSGCLEPRLPALGGDAHLSAGGTAYGWLFGLPEADAAVVEVLEVRAENRVVEALCRDQPGRAIQTERVWRDYLLEDGLSPPDTAAPASWRDPAAGLPAAGEPVATIEAAGTLRHQALARLVVRPLGRAGHDRLVVRTLIRLRVRFADPATIGPAPAPDGPFAALTPLLLNHAFLPHRISGVDDQATKPASGATDDDPSGRVVETPPVIGAAPWLPSDDGPAGDARAMKLIVNRDGPVGVTGAALAAAGWDLDRIEPHAISLASGGIPVAMAVHADGPTGFEAASSLVFQGQAMTGPYTRDNVYWLRQSGPARRFPEREGTPEQAAVARVFTETVRFEEDTRLVFSMDPQSGEDRWVWGAALTAPASVTHTLAVHNVAPSPGAARLIVAVRGYTDDRLVSPDHHIRLWWNGRQVHDSHFDGRGAHRLAAALPAGLVVEGDNEFVLESVGDTGAVVDAVLLDRIELEYPAGYAATRDRIDFSAPSAGRFTFVLEGFTTSDVTVLDTSDPFVPADIVGAQVEPAAAGTFTVRFTDTATDSTRYTAYTGSAMSAPDKVIVNSPSDLRSDDQGADYIIVVHPDHVAAVSPLANHRGDQGLRVATVLVDDIYDEFSFGVFDPRAIRAFLQHAFEHWAKPAPTYVLLVGESNLDYRGGYGRGPRNFVPSMQFDCPRSTELTWCTSDLWFAALQGDVLPDVLLGRISGSSSSQVATIVEKILRYETGDPSAPWRERAVLVADDDGAPAFESLSEDLAATMPAGTDVRRFYAATYPRDRNLTADIRSAIEEGAFALNFAGHGNVATWSPWPGGGRIFQNSDIRSLQNGDRMPVYTAATCMNGWIDNPVEPVSMTEQWLLQPAGGGVVAWAASGFASAAAEGALLRPFYQGLYDGRGLPVGALTAEAALIAHGRSSGHAEVIRMFVLLADPALVASGVPIRPTPTATHSPTAAVPRPFPLYMPVAVRGR